MSVIRIGTRRSALAKAQAAWAMGRLSAENPGVRFETVEFTTTGDRLATPSLAAQGGKGLFVKELEEALLAGEIQVAVHSAKDMPVALPEGLEIAAFPEREDTADYLVVRAGLPFPSTGPGQDGGIGVLEAFPKGTRIGTASLRRRAQALAANPDLRVEPLRGNVDTRLARLAEGKYDAVILAAAGVRRLKLAPAAGCRIVRLMPSDWLPAPAQGALALETRRDDGPARAAAQRIDHAPTRAAVEIERGFLRRMGGDCATPIAALAHLHGEHAWFSASVWSPDGRRAAKAEAQGHPETLCETVCRQLDSQGAAAILSEIRG